MLIYKMKHLHTFKDVSLLQLQLIKNIDLYTI
jgi:hypothetical protein